MCLLLEVVLYALATTEGGRYWFALDPDQPHVLSWEQYEAEDMSHVLEQHHMRLVIENGCVVRVEPLVPRPDANV